MRLIAHSKRMEKLKRKNINESAEWMNLIALPWFGPWIQFIYYGITAVPMHYFNILIIIEFQFELISVVRCNYCSQFRSAFPVFRMWKCWKSGRWQIVKWFNSSQTIFQPIYALSLLLQHYFPLNTIFIYPQRRNCYCQRSSTKTGHKITAFDLKLPQQHFVIAKENVNSIKRDYKHVQCSTQRRRSTHHHSRPKRNHTTITKNPLVITHGASCT